MRDLVISSFIVECWVMGCEDQLGLCFTVLLNVLFFAVDWLADVDLHTVLFVLSLFGLVGHGVYPGVRSFLFPDDI